MNGQISMDDDEMLDYGRELEAARKGAEDRLLRENRRRAFDSVSASVKGRQSEILELIGESPDGMTVSDIVDVMYERRLTPYWDRNFVAPRVTELKKMGAIVAIGRRESRSGRSEAVWMKKDS